MLDFLSRLGILKKTPNRPSVINHPVAAPPPPPEVSTSGVTWQEFKAPKAKELDMRSFIFDLSSIPDKWHLLMPAYVTPKPKQEEAARGGLASHIMLKDLLALQHPGWNRVKSHVKVGILKETGDCGNTSVSMGFAVKYFEKNPANRYVAFVNCGTESMKLQLYARHVKPPLHVALIAEAKTKGGEYEKAYGSPSQVICGDYRPLGKTPAVSVSENASRIKTLLGKAPWSEGDEKVDTFCFITGTIRNFFESQSTKKGEMDLAMKTMIDRKDALPVSRFLEDVPESYFISQQLECQMELVAVRAMYESLFRARRDPNWALELETKQPGGRRDSAFAHPPPAPQEEYEVFSSLGIGTGSTQLASLSRNTSSLTDYQCPVIPFQYGMKNRKLLKFGRFVRSFFEESNPDAIDELVAVIDQILARKHKPLIALKSGCCIFFELYDSNHALRNQLCAEVTEYKSPSEDEIRVFYHFGDLSGTALLNKKWSVSKLCMEAARILNVRDDFCSVQIEIPPPPTPPSLEKKITQFFPASPALTTSHSPPAIAVSPPGAAGFATPASPSLPPRQPSNVLPNLAVPAHGHGVATRLESCRDAVPNCHLYFTSMDVEMGATAKWSTRANPQNGVEVTIRLTPELADAFEDYEDPADLRITTQFSDILRNYFGRRNETVTPFSFECIARVYHLLTDLGAAHANCNGVTTKSGGVACPLKAELLEIGKKWHDGQGGFNRIEGQFRALSGEQLKRSWIDEHAPTVVEQATDSVRQNHVNALLLKAAFEAKLKTIPDELKKGNPLFEGAYTYCNVKTLRSLKRKLALEPGQGKDKKTAKHVLDYLRATILLGGTLEKLSDPTKHLVWDQVSALMHLISLTMGPIWRVKAEPSMVAKGFLITNVHFKQEEDSKVVRSLICEIQIRYPSPNDDHVGMELERCFSVATPRHVVEACVEFFRDRCSFDFSVNRSVCIYQGSRPQIHHNVYDPEQDETRRELFPADDSVRGGQPRGPCSGCASPRPTHCSFCGVKF